MANELVERGWLMRKINASFSARDPSYRATKTRFRDRLEALNIRMKLIEEGGRSPLLISEQISLEAQWLINYTDRWARADATLDRFEASLSDAPQMLSQASDGSYAAGCTEWYRKVEPTVGFLQSDEVAASEPGKKLTLVPLTFMAQLQNPDWVIAYLEGVRVSHIEQTGRNHRDEFGSLLTSVAQLVFKKTVQDALTLHPEAGFTVSDDLFRRFRDYVWSLQSKSNGYWGPSYQFDSPVIDVQDLSLTFHVVHYYRDGGAAKREDIPLPDKIAVTTSTVSTYVYPNGWKPEPPSRALFSDHNNYDVATIYRDMWSHMSTEQRDGASASIRDLLAWCLTQSLQPDDTFAPSPDMSDMDSFYYGVQFLQVVGFWSQASAFWTGGKPMPLPPEIKKSSKEIAAALLAKFEKDVDDHSDSAETVLKTLKAAL